MSLVFGRSGEVGHFPDLIEFTQSRIRQLCPSHAILTAEDNVCSKYDLGPQWEDVEQELLVIKRTLLALGLSSHE